MSEPRHVKVFVSYSHDSAEHMDRVLQLSDSLRADGVDCEIDQYETSPPGGWPRWTLNKIEEADYVLIVCTETYELRYEAREKKGLGAGAKWEGGIITQRLYESEGAAHRFIPVTFSAEDVRHIPLELRGSPFYVLDGESGYKALYRHLTGQPEVIKKDLGSQKILPPRARSRSFAGFEWGDEAGAQPAPAEGEAGPGTPDASPAFEDATAPAGTPIQDEPRAVSPPGNSRARGVLARNRRKLLAASVVLLLGLGAAYLFWPRRHVAVIPFTVESSDRDIEHLSTITTDFLERSLSRVPQILVQAHTSVSYYTGKHVSLKQIGEELNVQTFLTGKIRQRDNRMSVDVALIDARTEEPLWHKSYQDEITSLPSLQSAIARDVAAFLSPRMSDTELGRVAKNDTTRYEALELYSQGLQLWNGRYGQDGNIEAAIPLFEEAVNIDEHYAQAFIGLADCNALREDSAGQRAVVTLKDAEDNVDRALDIDRNLAAAHASKGFILFNRWDWEGAEKEYKRAIELNPDYPTTYQWYSVLLRTLGGTRFDEALPMINRAKRLDKLSPSVISNVGVYYLSKGDTENAADQFGTILKYYPNSAPAQRWLAMTYIKQGRPEEALSALQKGIEKSTSSGTLEFAGYIYALAGKREEALGIAEELKKRYQDRKAIAFNVAVVYAGLGEKDEAIRWLWTAYEDRSGALPFMRMPMFDSLRGDSRYDAILNKMGLTP